MGMGLLIALWIGASASLIWRNMDILESISTWRSVAAIVILVIGAPVFFLSDLLEFLLDWIMGEEES